MRRVRKGKREPLQARGNNPMRSRNPPGPFPAGAVAFATLLALWGCDSGAPPVSSSTAQATVHGTVKYKGSPLDSGTIQFDPANIRRRDARMVSLPLIGKDGTYTIKTLQGGNVVRFSLPALYKRDPKLATATREYDVPSGDSTFNVELTP